MSAPRLIPFENASNPTICSSRVKYIYMRRCCSYSRCTTTKLEDQSFSLRDMKKSRVISKLNQLLAILGATLSKFGAMPLYRPLTPSCATMTLIASNIDLYWYPMPDMVLIWKRRRRTSLCLSAMKCWPTGTGGHSQWVGTSLSNSA